MSKPKYLRMPPALTETDELWFEFRLKTWPRELRNWLRREGYLAEISGINRCHISEIENGKRDVHMSLVAMLAQCFNMTIAEFLKGV